MNQHRVKIGRIGLIKSQKLNRKNVRKRKRFSSCGCDHFSCLVKGTEEEEEIAANCLWLVTNSKKCPNCSISIQKNEGNLLFHSHLDSFDDLSSSRSGCNHIKCVKCKYDFCWICLEAWKKHSSTTGGYFQCNRYETVNKIVAKEKELVTAAEQRHLRMVELNKVS